MEAVAVDLGGKSPIHALVTKKGIVSLLSSIPLLEFAQSIHSFSIIQHQKLS